MTDVPTDDRDEHPGTDGPDASSERGPSGATGEASEPTRDEHAADDEPGDGGTDGGGPFDLKGILRQFTAPMIESLDARLKEQIEVHVDETLTARVDAAVADRLSTVDRAIADLSRSLAKLEDRLDAHDRAEEPKD